MNHEDYIFTTQEARKQLSVGVRIWRFLNIQIAAALVSSILWMLLLSVSGWLELPAMLDAILEDLDEIQENVDEIQGSLNEIQKSFDAMIDDLDKRITKLESFHESPSVSVSELPAIPNLLSYPASGQ